MQHCVLQHSRPMMPRQLGRLFQSIVSALSGLAEAGIHGLGVDPCHALWERPSTKPQCCLWFMHPCVAAHDFYIGCGKRIMQRRGVKPEKETCLNRNNRRVNESGRERLHNVAVTYLLECMGHGGVGVSLLLLVLGTQHHTHIVISVTHQFPPLLLTLPLAPQLLHTLYLRHSRARSRAAHYVAARNHRAIDPVGRLRSVRQGLLRHDRTGRRLASCIVIYANHQHVTNIPRSTLWMAILSQT